ncbi:DUF4129 domain-containing protein [Salinadaptatus halalkaliphilus]|uniref:DUF4129 domain-containing protein n=1 Tax=Salinadaptatus halalkaliphilus TaxID=2419781 RepID=A0A4S3TQH1_9EURY|nr:DUF4129 domain-containing protein [Salinadaptatus halalkaliphilus]
MRLDADGTVDATTFRLFALASVLVLTASYVSVLREVTRVVGGTQSLLAIVGAALLVATVLARAIRPRTAGTLAILAGVGGFAYYFEAAGIGSRAVLGSADELLSDALTLATGLPLLQMIEAGVWTLAFAPAPVFLSWYLALRGRYALSVVPGGVALLFLVLTGDAGTTVTLVGTLGALATVGFGELTSRGGSIAQLDLLAVLFAVVIVLSLSATFVPSGPANPTTAGASDPGTLEGAIDSSPERSGIAGDVDLSPAVRFTVESERPSYWRTGVYDRFTGDEWLRSGQEEPFEGQLETPPGEFNRVEQTVQAESDLGVVPVAPEPVDLDGPIAQDATVSSHGQVHPTTTLREGERYTVESAVVLPQREPLQQAGTDYPEEITDHYLQRPEDTSSEFDERTAEITDDAETPLETAIAIEQYLRTSKEYSLEVERPTDNVAEAFLLEMEEGYCVYYATAMTQMLRAEDVPARYVSGYSTGEPVGDDTYVVRGLDAHAWVEVYFPDHGWVAFEPTPPSDRNEVHGEELEQAREDGLEDVDTPASADAAAEDPSDDGEETTDDATDEPEQPDDDETNESEPNETDDGGDDVGSPAPDDATTGDDADGLTIPVTVGRETIALAAVLLFGVVAGIHRAGMAAQVRRSVGCYWHGRRGEPDRDVVRAYRRLEWLLADEYRPRCPGESARGYLEALATEGRAAASAGAGGETSATAKAETHGDSALATDPRVRDVLEHYERAVYGGGLERAEADEAIETVDELARERLPFVGRSRFSDREHQKEPGDGV